MGIIPVWVKLALVALAVATIAGFAAHKMHQYDTAKLVALKAEYESSAAKQAAKVAAATIKQQEITNSVRSDYENRLLSIRKYYASPNRVREQSPSSSRAVPKVPAASSGVNATAADSGTVAPELNADASEPLMETLPERCAETTVQLLALQDWVRSQAAATNAQ